MTGTGWVWAVRRDDGAWLDRDGEFSAWLDSERAEFVDIDDAEAAANENYPSPHSNWIVLLVLPFNGGQ